MPRNPPQRRIDSEPTLSGRLASAFASTLFFGPLMGLLWLLLNAHIATVGDAGIPLSYLGGAVAGFALLSFVFPGLAPDVFGWLSGVLVRFSRWLW